MESTKIEKLLAAYFEGNTTLEEERLLKDYFEGQVADEFVRYQPIFAGLRMAGEERATHRFQFPKKSANVQKKWMYAAASLLVVAFGLGSIYFSQPRYTEEEREALAAFEKSRKAMVLLSENLNKGAEQLGYVKQFGITKDKIFE